MRQSAPHKTTNTDGCRYRILTTKVVRSSSEPEEGRGEEGGAAGAWLSSLSEFLVEDGVAWSRGSQHR
jgi:hypothetical protein